jgi:hypothetical protein
MKHLKTKNNVRWVFWGWTFFIILLAYWDTQTMPFIDHTRSIIMRIVVAILLYVFFVLDERFTSFEKKVVFPAFLIFWFWWLFDTTIGIIFMENPFYIGDTSMIDRMFNEWNWALVWLGKAALAVVPASYMGNIKSRRRKHNA